MVVRRTTNREEVLSWKKHKKFILDKNALGLIPIGNRPKPIYIFANMTMEEYHIESFDLMCDKMEAE